MLNYTLIDAWHIFCRQQDMEVCKFLPAFALDKEFAEIREEVEDYAWAELRQRIDEVVEISEAAFGDRWVMNIQELWRRVERQFPEPRAKDGYQKKPIPPQLRKQVLERDAYRCKQCEDWHNLHVDHIIPESKGGPTTLENLQVLCRTCNLRKGNRV